MTTIELKEKLIAKINETDNEGLLDQISHLIAFEAEGIYEMSIGEIEAVETGLAQLDKGEWLSHTESNKQIEEWLKK